MPRDGKYDRLYAATDGYLWTGSASRFVQSHVTGDSFASAVDLGCGDGKNLSHLARAVAGPVLGVDLSNLALRSARVRIDSQLGADARDKPFLLRADVARMPLNGRFGLAVCCGVAHCLDNASLRSLKRWLERMVAPGGRVLVTAITSALALPGEHGTGPLYLRSGEEYLALLGEQFRLTFSEVGIVDDAHPPVVGPHVHEVLRAVWDRVE